jgi:hypothetical protein
MPASMKRTNDTGFEMDRKMVPLLIVVVVGIGILLGGPESWGDKILAIAVVLAVGLGLVWVESRGNKGVSLGVLLLFSGWLIGVVMHDLSPWVSASVGRASSPFLVGGILMALLGLKGLWSLGQRLRSDK